MRTSPIQIGMSLMISGSARSIRCKSLAEGIARGRLWLSDITHEDFGYDLLAWNDYFQKSDSLRYRWRGKKPPDYRQNIESTIRNQEWQEAVAIAESESFFEKLIDHRKAIAETEREWAGKSRCCPNCNSEFRSVQDLGQCRKCGHIFYASGVPRTLEF